MSPQVYESPLATRYASEEMQAIFSRVSRAKTWRVLWHSLARAQHELGLSITKEQLASLDQHCDSIDLDRIDEIETQTHHDVMAHLLAYGEQCPDAKGILHLGATSCYVTDNGDLYLFRSALQLLEKRTKTVLSSWGKIAENTACIPTVGWTHFQPAQPTTVGKRICLWLQDLLIDLRDLKQLRKELPFLGMKGATGTQSSLLSLFGGDQEKIVQLEQKIAAELGFTEILPISGQTYTRKIDQKILFLLAGIGATTHKWATDLRLLAHLGEMAEGFAQGQVGSSAMPHKRNPILAERICSLARFVISLSENGSYTLATQWLERSLDDSANRRLAMTEAFLGVDAILLLLEKMAGSFAISKEVIDQNLQKQMAHLLAEPLLMHLVKKGEDRQTSHEKLRRHFTQGNAFFEAIAADQGIPLSKEEIAIVKENWPDSGLAERQVKVFLDTIVHRELSS